MIRCLFAISHHHTIHSCCSMLDVGCLKPGLKALDWARLLGIAGFNSARLPGLLFSATALPVPVTMNEYHDTGVATVANMRTKHNFLDMWLPPLALTYLPLDRLLVLSFCSFESSLASSNFITCCCICKFGMRVMGSIGSIGSNGSITTDYSHVITSRNGPNTTLAMTLW